MNKTAIAIIKIACYITLTLSILLIGLFICINSQAMTRLFSDTFNTYQLTNYSHDQVTESAVLTRDFSVGKISEKQLSDALNSIGVNSSDLDASMITHLTECTPIFSAIAYIEVACAILSILFLFILSRNCGSENIAKIIRIDCHLTIAIIALLLLLLLANFDVVFENMHKLLFKDGTWTFNYDSLLICMYPENFWIAMGASLCLISLAISAIGLLVARRLAKLS